MLENQQQGTTSWQFTVDHKAQNHEIEGYASLTSVNKGGQISFMVSLSSSAQYTMDVYRMGWYPQGTNPDGSSCAPSCGGRLMLHVGPAERRAPGDVSSGDDTERPGLRSHRMHLDTQLHAVRADLVDDRATTSSN